MVGNRNAPNSTTHRSRKDFRLLRQRQQAMDHDEDPDGDLIYDGQRKYHRPQSVVDEKGIAYVTGEGSGGRPWLPNAHTSFKLILSARLASAFWSSISDCDETFNYWEPMHYLMFGKGFQTWEYDPKFALRSYLYVLSHLVPAWAYDLLFSPNRMYIFYFTRCLLAVVSSACELYFYQGVAKEVGANVARITLAFMVFGAGFFISTTAFLPSTTSMYLVMLSHGAWFHQSYSLAIFFTALSTFLSWPFACLMGVPIALDVLVRQRKVWFFVKWSLISAVTILLPQVAVDSDYYGKFVSAPFNIVKYNVFTNHGPDLYGVEPWHYYLFNGILNFNVAFLLSLLVILLHYPVKFLIGLPNQSRHFIPHYLTHMALHLWFLVFGIQPHKEERFLFPAYPLICLGAATTVDLIQKLCYFLFVKVKVRHYLSHTQWLSISSIIVYSLLCMSRVTSLYVNYHAPLDTWMHLSHLPHSEPENYPPHLPVSVCIGKEWHRFPNSFFLPSNDWELKFLKSEFRGQLPQLYGESTKQSRNTFNDQNLEETNRYVSDPAADCDFIVDLENPNKETALEPIYSKQEYLWREELTFEFLDAENSHKLFRSFYVPFVSNSKCKFSKYVLLRNIGKKRRKKKH